MLKSTMGSEPSHIYMSGEQKTGHGKATRYKLTNGRCASRPLSVPTNSSEYTALAYVGRTSPGW